MKSKILFICCFILLLCGCSKKEDTKTEELLTNNDIGFTIIVEDGRGITKDSRINHINDYIGDQYIESKKDNDTVYYNDSIQITLNKKNKVKKVELNETGTEYKKPKDGNQFIIITVQYENKSDEPVNYSSRNWKLENKDKEETQRIFTALDVNTALYSGKLVIGATKVGTLVFEQSKKYDSFKLNFYELKEEKKETKENVKEDKKTVKEDEKNTEEEKEKPIFSINIKIENKDKGKEKEKSKEESKNKATQTTKKETKDKELSKK